MAEVYSVWKGPTFQPLTANDMMADALDQPMGFLDTLGDQALGGVLASPGAGTAIREALLPDRVEAPPKRRMANEDLSIREARQREYDTKLYSKEEYTNSPYFRSEVPWDNGMTEERAAALAMQYDARKVREYFASKRPYTSFVGGLAGQAADPLNYIPVAGPVVKGAAAVRLGRLGGAMAAGAADAVSNTALGQIAAYNERKSFGDDVSWQATVSELAMAGLIGSAFGGITGAVDIYRTGKQAAKLAERQKLITEQMSTLANTQNARIALNEAIDSVVRGEDVRISPNAYGPIIKMADDLNPVFRPETFGSLDRTNLFSSTAVGRVIDNRPVMVRDFEDSARLQVFSDKPELEPQFRAAEDKFKQAQEAVAALEEPIQARKLSDAVALVDSDSAARVAAIETELEGAVPAQRRAALEAERDMIVESLGPGVVEKAENDFRIGPEKKIKAARKALATARQEFSKVRTQVDNIARQNIAANELGLRTRIDTSVAKPEPEPEGVQPAAARVGKPEDTKGMAEQFGVNPEDGSFIEQSDIDQVRQEGRLTEEDEAELQAADETLENSEAFGKALSAAVACLI